MARLRFRPLASTYLTIALCAALLVTSSLLSSSTRAAGTQLTLVAYSTPATVYAQLIPAFQQTSAGRDVQFTQSFGASGDQAQAVANGLHADVVEFSIALDMLYLEHRNLVPASWKANKYAGMVTDSIVVFVVRKGNPKHIKTWDDLVKKGIDVITPNPFTSGSARWNIMAAYGAQIAQGRTKKQALAYLAKLFNNVSVQDKSGRDALNTFASGKGDVLLSYENEAIGAQQKGIAVDYITPPQSILIENPIAVTTGTKSPTQAKAFLKFLYSTAGQTIFARNGYRPVVTSVLKKFHFRNPHTLFTIHKLGSWPNVQKQFFDPEYGVIASIERKKGIAP